MSAMTIIVTILLGFVAAGIAGWLTHRHYVGLATPLTGSRLWLRVIGFAVLALLLGFLLFLLIGYGMTALVNKVSLPEEPSATLPPPAAPSGSTANTSLNYDETNADALVPGQSQLIAVYLRIAAPITQGQLENAVSAIQQEAAAANATTFQGSSLTLDQHRAWLVWCSDSTNVDPPADVSLVHEITLLASNTLGRVWIQVPFADGVPLRSDDTWTGCNGTFWAVAVH